jgi:dipeptidyl aminopeptidase/acylaminoacyl peptidase
MPDGKRVVLVAAEGESDDDEKKKKDKDDALVVESDLKPARVYLVSLPDGKTDLLYSSAKHISSISVSPTGEELAFAEQPTPKVPDSFNSNMRVLNVATKAVRDLVSTETSNSDPKFSPDGKWIAFEASSRTDWWGNSHIYAVPAAGGQSKNLTAQFDERPSAFQWAEDSSAVYFAGPRRMDVGIFKASLDGKLETVDVRTGMSMSISIANGTMAYEFESPTEANNVYFASLRAPAAVKKGKPVAWAFTPKKVSDLNPQVKDLALAKVETMKWRNRSDGMEIEGQLFLPADYRAGKTYPTLLIIHGGPAGLFNNAFVMRRGAYPVQVFTSSGYAVLMPNPRGSGGYGLAFRKANVKDWGYADYHDIQNGVDELIDKGIADRDRLGVMGWSYGGFMTSWTVTQSSRFKAASIGAAVTNLFSFYGTTDIPPFIESYFGAKPWEDRELMARHSAMYHLDKVTTPSLLQHGGEDRRVPYAQSEEFFTGLRMRGIPSELIKYPRQPHGIQEPKLIKDAMTRNLEWFDRYVLGNQQAAKWHTTGGTAVAATPGQQ